MKTALVFFAIWAVLLKGTYSAPVVSYGRLFARIQFYSPGGVDPSQRLICTHVVKCGETLDDIAEDAGTTEEKLMELNPRITNPEMIRSGDVIKILCGNRSDDGGGGCSGGDDDTGDIGNGGGFTAGSSCPGSGDSGDSDEGDGDGEGEGSGDDGGGSSEGGDDTGGACTHTVKSGDTLFAIAQAAGTTVKKLLEMNPQIKNPDLIHPGDVINIPCGNKSNDGGGGCSGGGDDTEDDDGSAGGALPVFCGCFHTVESGDTLFSIAQAAGTTVKKLLEMNPQIKNPDLIRVGDVITIPCGNRRNDGGGGCSGGGDDTEDDHGSGGSSGGGDGDGDSGGGGRRMIT